MGRGPSTGPRAGSRARIALEKLHEIGGRASLLEWMRALSYDGSTVIFRRDVIRYLDGTIGGWKLIFGSDAGYEINDAGLDALGIPVDAPAVAAPVLVGARYTVGIRELNTRRHCARMPLTREGALDYRDIPSKMGDERVAYKSEVKKEKPGCNMQQSTTKPRLIKLPAVLERVPVSKTEWYRQIKKGTAPSPVRLSIRSVAWLESDIDAFITGLLSEHDRAGGDNR